VAPAEVPGQGARGLLDVGQIGQAVAQRRGHGDDRYVEAGARARIRRRPDDPASSTLCNSAEVMSST
jgi:hypothetical protein